MFNLLFISIFALITNNVLDGAEIKKNHYRQPANILTAIPSDRKRVTSLPSNILPVTLEDNLQTQDNLLRHSAPVLNNPPQIVPDDLSTRSLSEGSVVNQNPQKDTNQYNRKKSNSISFKKLSHRKPTKAPSLAPIAEKQEHALLTATRNLNIDLIKFYLSGNTFNPNKPRDQFGNTAFHIIAAKKSKLHSSTEKDVEEKIKTTIAILNIFLKDYRTDFSIVNNAGSTPRDLFSSDLDIIYRRLSFSRCSLNIVVNKYAEKLKDAFSCGSISPEVIEEVAQHIIGELKYIEASQAQDRILPSESRLPADLTIYFVEQMLKARLDYITSN